VPALHLSISATLFLPAAANQAQPSASPYPLIILVLLACWAGLALSLPFSWRYVRKACFTPAEPGSSLRPVAVALGVAGCTLMGLCLRVWLSPRLPMLSTYAGLEHVTAAYSIAGLEWAASFQSAYPLAVPALSGVIMKITGLSPAVFFYTGCAVSLLAVPSLYVVGRILWGRPQEGLIAAFLAALFPPMLIFSTSGTLALPYAGLASLSMALLLLWLKSGKGILLAALMCALLLTLQTRLEAVVFIVPVIAAFLLQDGAKRNDGPHLLLKGRNLTVICLFFLLSLPYLLTKVSELAGASPGGHPPSWEGMAQLFFRCAFVVGFFFVWGKHHENVAGRLLVWSFLVMSIAWFFFLEQMFGGEVFKAGAMPFAQGASAATYAPVGILYLDPKLVPVALILAYFASYMTVSDGPNRRIWLLLHLWLVPVFAMTALKATGELPFPGVRTALAALPPFVLLSARGITALTSLWGRLPVGAWLKIAVAVAGCILAGATFVGPFCASLDCRFNQQEEYEFVRNQVESLPDNAIVILPAGEASVTLDRAPEPEGIRVAELFRTRSLFLALLGENERRVRVGGAVELEVQDALSAGIPVFYYEGLNCFRTGSGRMSTACAAFHATQELDSVAQTKFENRMYNSDFFDSLAISQPSIRLTLYRLSR